MAFEVYHSRKQGSEKVINPIVRLSKNSIVLDKTARQLLENPEYVELAYDSDEKIIRIVPSNNGTQVKKTKLPAQRFYKVFEIDVTGKFNGVFNEEEKALFVNLKASA